MEQIQQLAAWKAEMVAIAAKPYQVAGRFAWHFAKGKLGGDPVFSGLLQHGFIPNGARILDLGCGQGLLAAWLRAADVLCSAGNWPQNWPTAPKTTTFRGIELMPRDVQRGAAITCDSVCVQQGDIRTADFGHADIVVILDVLHYIDIAAQDDVLRRVRAALGTNGTLLLRIGNAAGGWPFRISNWVDFMAATARGHRLAKLHCRTLDQWRLTLQSLGFAVKTVPMSQGTPFANVLLIGEIASQCVH